MWTDFQNSFTVRLLRKMLYAHIIKILHLILSMFLHYFVKLENYNYSRFQWHIACETSEFILQDMNTP